MKPILKSLASVTCLPVSHITYPFFLYIVHTVRCCTQVNLSLTEHQTNIYVCTVWFRIFLGYVMLSTFYILSINMNSILSRVLWVYDEFHYGYRFIDNENCNYFPFDFMMIQNHLPDMSIIRSFILMLHALESPTILCCFHALR